MICPKCKDKMIRIAKVNEKTTGIDYYYFESRCGYRVKESGEEIERNQNER
jgi:NMD protein affecting ribosome stability and mRNA decay